MQQKALPSDRPHDIGALIRSARENPESGPISVRELSRRSGISAGQISRIESGQTAKPSGETLTVLAEALGADPVPLLFLAGHLDESEALPHLQAVTIAIGDLKDVAEAIVDQLFDSVGYDADIRKDPLAGAGFLFLASTDLAGVAQGLFDLTTMSDVGEVVTAWSGLTRERQKLVRAFVADQEVLSKLDRLPNPRHGRRMSVDLQELESEAATDE